MKARIVAPRTDSRAEIDRSLVTRAVAQSQVLPHGQEPDSPAQGGRDVPPASGQRTAL